MKLLLLVQRDSDCSPWVEDAVDEYTLDTWNGEMPETMQKKFDEDPENFRKLWVEIPDGALDRLWDVPTVAGQVRQQRSCCNAEVPLPEWEHDLLHPESSARYPSSAETPTAEEPK